MTNKVAIITGSSRGIGRAIAEKLAAEKFAVVVNYVSNKTEADEVEAGIKKAGGKVIVVPADVSDLKAAAKLFDEAEKAFGGVDVLVNNAGVIANATIAETDEATYDRMMNINVKGSFNMMQLAAKKLRENGRIINFSSSVVPRALMLPTYGVYAATKGAIEALTKVLANELGPKKITVNAVAPGPVATELFLNGKTEEFIERMVQSNPFKRLGEVEDIAEVVAFLASPASGWLNGQIIRANGGIA